MLRFLTCCLLIVPFSHGLNHLHPTAIAEDDHHDDDHSHSLTVLKTDRELEEEIYNNITSHVTSAFLPPVAPNEDGEHGPVHVKVNTYIRDILEVKNVDNNLYDWSVDLVFRQMWHDERLAYDVSHHPHIKHITLSTADGIKSIWKPDTFFAKSIHGEFHHLLSPNAYVWVYPNGDVRYSVRVSVTFRCKKTDMVHAETTEEAAAHESTLVCPVRIASYGWNDDQVVYEWDDDKTAPPVHHGETLYLPHHTLDKVTTESYTHKTRSGGFSSLIAKFHFSDK